MVTIVVTGMTDTPVQSRYQMWVRLIPICYWTIRKQKSIKHILVNVKIIYQIKLFNIKQNVCMLILQQYKRVNFPPDRSNIINVLAYKHHEI